jgi:uncharacterized protein YkwD
VNALIPFIRGSLFRVPTVLKAVIRIAVATLLLTSLAVPALAGQFEDELLVLINRYRASRKLKPLVSSPACSELAREHSLAMLEHQRMSHDGADDRFKRSGASSCVENVGWNHETPQSLFTGWKESPGHNRNMLERKISMAGISKSGAYVTFFACY